MWYFRVKKLAEVNQPIKFRHDRTILYHSSPPLFHTHKFHRLPTTRKTSSQNLERTENNFHVSVVWLTLLFWSLPSLFADDSLWRRVRSFPAVYILSPTSIGSVSRVFIWECCVIARRISIRSTLPDVGNSTHELVWPRRVWNSLTISAFCHVKLS